MESDQGKLFLGGISWETDEDTLKEHFSKYGTVLSVMIAKDRHTGDSRGFGFVSFSDSDSADDAFKDKHVILGRTVEVKRATPRSKEQPIQQQQQEGDSHSQHQENNGSSKKIFVGGLSDSLTEEEFKTYFEKFGRITDIVVMHDSMTNRPRGFGFVTFDSEESVEQVLQTNFHDLNGRRVEVKRAVPKERINGNYFNNGHWHGNYPPYSPGYGMLPVPGWDFYGTNIYGGYHVGGYNGIDYGIPPIGHRSPWNLLPYGYGYAHPRGYNLIVSPGINGRSNYIVVASNGVSPRREKRS